MGRLHIDGDSVKWNAMSAGELGKGKAVWLGVGRVGDDDIDDMEGVEEHAATQPLSAAVDPAWEARSDWAIYKGLAKAFSKVAPEVLGVDYLGPDAAVLRVQGKTRPGAQWRVGRQLRVKIAESLVAAGIEMPPSTYMRSGGTK